MARATRSFPVPDSPTIKTVMSVGATLLILSKTRRIRGETVTISASWLGLPGNSSISVLESPAPASPMIPDRTRRT